jgi:hypothetical protein
VDKPTAKCDNCDRELGESNISRLYVKKVYRIQTSLPLLNNLAGATRMMKMGEMGRKGGLGDLYGKFLQLHLHCICIRRKPHGLIARAWGKSLPGPAHGLEPTAQQLRPMDVRSPSPLALGRV